MFCINRSLFAIFLVCLIGLESITQARSATFLIKKKNLNGQDLGEIDLPENYSLDDSNINSEDVCARPDGCMNQMFQKYHRVLVASNGYTKKICRCNSDLKYQCGSKYCTASKEACEDLLKVIVKTKKYFMLNVEKCKKL